MVAARPGPSDRSALVIAVRLPAPLEALRLRSIADAAQGMPAHVTLLYPFLQPAAIDARVVAEVRAVVARHRRLTLTLSEGRLWPDTAYAAVEPDAELRALQADLAAAFPSLPLYGGAHAFEPHVSVIEGAEATCRAGLADAAWRALPVTVHAASVDCIVMVGDRWDRAHRLPLGAVAAHS